MFDTQGLRSRFLTPNGVRPGLPTPPISPDRIRDPYRWFIRRAIDDCHRTRLGEYSKAMELESRRLTDDEFNDALAGSKADSSSASCHVSTSPSTSSRRSPS